MRLILVITCAMLFACSPAGNEGSLNNTIALFKSNGLTMTPELLKEINWASKNIVSQKQLEDELASIKETQRMLDQIDRSDHNFADKEWKNKKYSIRNRVVALQIVAYKNGWGIDNRFRLLPGEL